MCCRLLFKGSSLGQARTSVPPFVPWLIFPAGSMSQLLQGLGRGWERSPSAAAAPWAVGFGAGTGFGASSPSLLGSLFGDLCHAPTHFSHSRKSRGNLGSGFTHGALEGLMLESSLYSLPSQKKKKKRLVYKTFKSFLAFSDEEIEKER